MSALRWFVLAACLVALPGQTLAQGAGVSPEGKKGRLHVVQPGDTLWDITDLYIGTPWIWPSVWIENEDIRNPHLIYPGDLIWITDGKMRKVTAEEAAALMVADSEAPQPPPAAPEPATPEPGPAPDPFAVLDSDRVVPDRSVRFAMLDHSSFVTDQELDAAGSVLGSHEEHYWLSQEDQIIVGLGEGQVNTGDRFSIFRIRRRVLHPETGKIAGYFVEVLGRSEIVDVHPESSFARVTHAYAEIEPGDRLMPYVGEPMEFVPVAASSALDGSVLAQQPHRNYSGEGDLVVLDQGSDGGLVTGNELILYRSGHLTPDPLTGARVMTPEDVIGRVFVLKSSRATALALVTEARTEIEPGDRFRTP